MASYFFSFSWGIGILFSLIGWGGAINSILFPKYRIDWGQKAAWGIAFSIFVGGVLNVTRIISRTTILAYLAAGLLYWLFDIFKTKLSDISLLSNRFSNYRKDKIVVIGFIAVFSLILLRYAGSVSPHPQPFQAFNWHDDFHAYFVFPEKMLQTGSMGPDPFSLRRLISSLGGQSFLHTFVLSVLSEKNLNIIDSGLGMIVVVGLILGYCKDKGISKRTAVFVLLFFLLIPPPKVNITALLIPIALFISLFRTLEWDGLKTSHFIADAFIIALLASGICSLKSSLIPACGIFFALSYFFYIVESKMEKKAICEFFIATILVITFLLPWMISMYQSSGTLLYPLLGKGYHGSAHGTYLSPASGLTIGTTIVLLLHHLGSFDVVSLVLLSCISFRTPLAQLAGRKASLSLSIGAILGTVIMLISTGFRVSRYNFPFVFAAIIILLIIALSKIAEKNKDRLTSYASVLVAIFIAVGMIIIGNWRPLEYYSPRGWYLKCTRNIKAGMRNIPLIPDEKVSQYAQMQLSIPQGQTILTRLAYPFLLDFKRNKIFIADYPGGASLPPGMPCLEGAEELADYLNSKSIRYVAYSYANEANFQKKFFGARLNNASAWIRTLAQHTFGFQDSLIEFGRTRKRIYDNGNIFVLDLLNHSAQE